MVYWVCVMLVSFFLANNNFLLYQDIVTVMKACSSIVTDCSDCYSLGRMNLNCDCSDNLERMNLNCDCSDSIGRMNLNCDCSDSLEKNEAPLRLF